jgi:hypothetical protein
MIRDIVEQAGFTIKEGNVINFGYQNGWAFSEKIANAYNKLKEYTVEGSLESETVGRCVTEYRRKLNDGTGTYTLISKVDSGD